ncbi:MAG: hypothetical protein ACK48V_04945 [Crocinitomicaceae bacterium]|jgi:hypothetical protein
MKKILFILYSVSISFSTIAQKVQKIARLPEIVTESSGLIFYNDTLLITHNDSGDKPILYFVNLKGKLIHQVIVNNANNVDWEDITKDDKGNIYIADIGNNSNQRKDLRIYKIKSHNLLNVNLLNAEIIEVSYNEQTDFPPKDEALNFDAEGIAYHNDSLWIITKCRSIPFEGNAYIYKFPAKSGKYNLKRKAHLFIGKDGFTKDAVTSLDIYNDQLYILTYNRILIYKLIDNKLEFDKQFYTKPYTQKEAITLKNKNEIYLTDESTKIIGGGYLYKLTIDAAKIKH